MLALHLAPDVSAMFERGRAIVTAHGVTVTLDDGSGVIRQSLESLQQAGATEERLAAAAIRMGGGAALRELSSLLERLRETRMLCFEVNDGGRRLLSAIPAANAPLLEDVCVDRSERLVLSRFAWLRRVSRSAVVECGLSAYTLILHESWLAELVFRLVAGTSIAELENALPQRACAGIAPCVELLMAARAVSTERQGGLSETDSGPLRYWQFHDLLFHTRSRLGRHTEGYGATYRFGRLGENPANGAQTPDSLSLPRPDLEQLERNDATFTAVVEGRRSVRVYAEEGPTRAELGEFLFRTAAARIRKNGDTYRLYPSGGGLYELQVYILVAASSDLESRLYRYDPQSHALQPRGAAPRMGNRLLENAARAMHSAGPPVLIILAANFRRMLSKYESMAYATILKDAGALLQTFNLVAHAMGLAGCILGGGDSDEFAAAAGTDYYEESSVGEFALGRAVVD